MTGQEEVQYKKMTETPIPRLITTMAVPTIISMLVTSVYNMADTFFVSKLGTSATGAVGIVYSLMAIIQAVGFMIGMGSGSQLSRLLGQKNQKEASEIGATGFYISIAFGLLLTVFGLIFIDPLLHRSNGPGHPLKPLRWGPDTGAGALRPWRLSLRSLPERGDKDFHLYLI